MQASIEERIRRLTEPMLRRKLYVVFSTPTAAPDQIKDCLPEHLEYMIALEKTGVVFASGPFTEGTAPPRGEGMTILHVSSEAEARQLAEADPFFTRGLRSFTIREWMLMEGALSMRINF